MTNFKVSTKYCLSKGIGTVAKITKCYVTFEFEDGSTARYLKRINDDGEYIKDCDGSVYFADIDSIKSSEPTSFDVGMRFGSVEVSKRTDRMVYLKSLENGLRTKKKVKSFKGGGEYIDMNIGTCEWLGIIGDDEFFKHTTSHPDKFRNELVYRLTPKGGGLDG
jgi:hypothetical protein